ncbi:MAG TPA: amidohydrolase family protein, partial [Frankiaceae bacterium]|nr:amidohydrolase family protein [Frankiaceae bacterium]
PSVVGDVGIRDGRIVAVGIVDEAAVETVDAEGLVACPGFVDPHTHYDAQLFWDPQASPSNVHGVTTVIGGNCSLSLAPLSAENADYNRRLLAKVEGMPLAALEQGVPWSWKDFGGYLGALDGQLGVNAGFLQGHSALRRHVMGQESNQRPASEEELARLRTALAESLEQGALGLSFDVSDLHSDGNNERVPARAATSEELIELCAVVGQHAGTTLEGIFVGGDNGFDEQEADLVARLSATANRPLNWNLLVVDARDPDRRWRQLTASRRAREIGGRVVALTMPTIVPMNMSFLNYCGLNLMPGWSAVLSLPVEERMARLQDPDTQQWMEARANSDEAGMFRRLADFGGYIIGDTHSAENEGLKGRVVRDIAAERGTEPFATLIDIVVSDRLATVLWPSAPDDDDAHWALRAEIWSDPDVMLGGSDAGAHLDRMVGASYPTQLLADCLRGRRLLTLEQAVKAITDDPARLFGLTDRGRLEPGFHADIVLFDPDTVGATPAELVHDLPSGAVRLTAGSTGVARVLVNGITTVIDGEGTGALPGVALRSGRDTETVLCR